MTLENKKVKIGITGGIGSGKTYICNLLRERGYEVYNCDDEAKRIMLEDEEIISQIKTLIGNDAYTPDGQLNKPVIANARRFPHDSAVRRVQKGRSQFASVRSGYVCGN